MAGQGVVVLGAGVAGMATALLLARDGHDVRVVERDRVVTGPPLDAPSWDRKGIAHFLQPHAFIPRGRLELLTLLSDVYDALIDAGAGDLDVSRKLPGGDHRPEDADLRYLAVRRPLIEWALRRAVETTPSITVVDGSHAGGLVASAGAVGGVTVDGSTLDASLVVDALGRRTPTPAWLGAAGLAAAETETTDCGVVYYSRYYRQRDGFELPDGPWLLSPRGDLGYMAYATFPGDNRTFAAVLAVPTGAAGWRTLKDAPAYEAAVATIPMLRMWVDPDGVDPITDVLTMAGLRNGLRHDAAGTPGLVPVGDALAHTDPVLAHGLAFSLVHAAALARAVRDHADVSDVGAAYAAAVVPAVTERFAFASQLDEQRHRMWVGEPVDFRHRQGDYALFSMAAAGAVATVDPDVFRVFARRVGLLDSTAVLDQDVAMQERIETRFAELIAAAKPTGAPTRDEMLQLIATAAG